MRYLRLWLALAKNSVIRQLEYRGDLLGGLVLEVVWLSTLYLFNKAVYSQVTHVGQWNESEMLFFTASVFFVDSLYMIFISKNSQRFSETIRSGIFDFYLLRPFSALFLSTFRYINITGFFNLAMAIILAWTANVGLTPMGFVIWLFYGILGCVLLYVLLILISSLAFWTTQTSSLQWLFFELYRLGHRPDDVYASWIRRFIIGIFPAALFISIPVKLSLGKLGGLWFLWPFVWVGIGVLAARSLWRRGLRSYEGALS